MRTATPRIWRWLRQIIQRNRFCRNSFVMQSLQYPLSRKTGKFLPRFFQLFARLSRADTPFFHNLVYFDLGGRFNSEHTIDVRSAAQRAPVGADAARRIGRPMHPARSTFAESRNFPERTAWRGRGTDVVGELCSTRCDLFATRVSRSG